MKIILYSNKEGINEVFSDLVKYYKSNSIYDTISNVELLNKDLSSFDNGKSLRKQINVNAKSTISLISPGNSFGIMSGGMDLVINKLFNNELEYYIQKKINDNHIILNPCSSISINCKELNINNIYNIDKIIYTPTMHTPNQLFPFQNIPYKSTLSSLNMVKEDVVLMPLFGIGTGGLDCRNVLFDIMAAIVAFNKIKLYIDSKKEDNKFIKLDHEDLIKLNKLI